MRWSIIGAGSAPDDLATISDAARSVATPAPATFEAVGDLLSDAATEGLVVLGDDAALAFVVAAMLSAGRDVPVALVPRAESDLLRMFAMSRAGIVARLQSGAPYRVDLGRVRIADSELPFVTHVTAAPPGPGRLLRRSAGLSVTTPRRTHRLTAWRVVAANAQHVSGKTIAPRAALTDGALDIQVFAGTLAARIRILRQIRQGLHLQHPAVWRRSMASCSVAAPANWRVTVDGVSAGSGAFEVAVEPGAFDLWI